MPTNKQITDLFNAYGARVSSEQTSQLGMKSMGEVEQIAKDTKNKVQSDALSSYNTAMKSLTTNLPPAYQDYAKSSLATTQQYQQLKSSSPEYQASQSADQYLSELVQKGPMFALAMRQDLAKISPSFLGVSRDFLDKKLAGIGNPFVRDKMVSDYMGYAEKATSMSLSVLGQLRDSALIAAKRDADDKKSQWEKTASVFDDALKIVLSSQQSILEEKLKVAEVKKVDNVELAGDIAGFFEDVQGRDAALAKLERDKTVFTLMYGEDGYKQLVSEVARRYPEEVEKPKESNNFLGNLFGGAQTTKPQGTSKIQSGMAELGKAPDYTGALNSFFGNLGF